MQFQLKNCTRKNRQTDVSVYLYLHEKRGLFVLSLSCCFRLLLALYAGLFIVLSLTELCEYTGACTLLLEATKSVIKRFAFSELNFCHFIFPPLANKEINGTIIH